MRRQSSSTISLLLLLRHFSTRIENRHRKEAIQHAQEVITDYFHNSRALPYPYAESITKNAPHSLSRFISKLPSSSPDDFRNTFLRFLRYYPIDEFDFFYESIGVDPSLVLGSSKPNVNFFSDDSSVVDAACCLAGFGFPWDRLGRLYVEQVSIFGENPAFLSARLNGLVSLGFVKQHIVAICFAFPGLLKGEGGDGFDRLLRDLKRVFVDFDLETCMVGNVDVWVGVCEKVKFFYELGVPKGVFGNLISKGKCIMTDYTMEVLVEKVDFFSRFGVKKSKVGALILTNPEILSIQLKDRVISVSTFLRHFGLRGKKFESVEQEYKKYVFGRNKMVNLPNILGAMDLHKWFIGKMIRKYLHLFASYDLRSPDDGLDKDYVQNLETVKGQRTHSSYTLSRLSFFHSIGFGENDFTPKLLLNVQGKSSDLQERFDFLLSEGIKWSKVCKMISQEPKVLNQETDSVKKKLDFLVEEIGFPLDYLKTFPAYLLYDLENHIKPRYKFHVWLTEHGWRPERSRKHNFATIISDGPKTFLLQLSRIHPTAPQLWMEQYGNIEIDCRVSEKQTSD